MNDIITGTSKAAELIRTIDWSQTALGDLQTWPESLTAAVNTILNARMPMQLFWGPEFICIYNDAMTPTLSTKHPGSMGSPAREVWSEAWDTIGPQMEKVLTTGSSVYETDFFLPLLSEGVLQDHYWTYGYSPVYNGHGEIVGVLDVAQDVTASVQARQIEVARRESEERLRAFTNATNNALYQMSADWSLMYQLNGKSFLADTQNADAHWLTKYIHPLDHAKILETIGRSIAAKSIFELEHRVLRADGSFGWASSRAIPILDEAGNIRHWFGAATDITEKKLIEAALVEGEKLTAVGKLASSIAHEINNPLEAVTNLLFLARQHAVKPEVLNWLDQADVELKRASAITSKTLRFHRQATNPQPITCTSLFTSTLDLYESRLRNSRVNVEMRKRAESPVLCFEGDIRQVLSNVVSNAIDSMPGGGRLLVRSREGTEWSTGRKGLTLTIADTGTGMSTETRSRALDAFYTTKGIKGSGLGLWISKQIMDRHKGAIKLRSSQREAHHGTVVAIFIPFVERF